MGKDTLNISSRSAWTDGDKTRRFESWHFVFYTIPQH